jgi:hypothetical protein
MHIFNTAVYLTVMFLISLSLAAPTDEYVEPIDDKVTYNVTASASASWGHCTPGQLYCFNEIIMT